MRRYPRRSACLVTALLLAVCGFTPSGAAAEDERDLEPLPRVLVFPDPAEVDRHLQTSRTIEDQVQRNFASLGTVAGARHVLVRRFGVLSMPALMALLRKDNAETQGWNAALTVAALREVHGPAIEIKPALRPLVRTLTGSAKPHDRAFAALALGCFHWPEADLPKIYAERAGYYDAVPGTGKKLRTASEALKQARTRLVDRCNDKQAFMRVAALLALAKMGGPDVRTLHAGRTLDAFANANPQRAAMLTDAFLGTGKLKTLLQATRDEDRRVRAAAALAMAVAILQERPATWTRDHDVLLKAVRFNGTSYDRVLEDGAEAVFARGVIALQRQSNDEWKKLWALATGATTKALVAESAAQTLRFCDVPWFRDAVVLWATKPPTDLKPSVLALVLLRAGELGSPDAIDGLVEWLRIKSRRPVPNERWDPRWYAAVGLLRALQEGRIRPKKDRVRVIEALRKSVAQVLDRKCALRAALALVLEGHGKRIAEADESAVQRLPLASLRAVERSFRCPHSLLSRDVIDTCARRVNDMVHDSFGLSGIIPGKPGEPPTKQMPERYLRRYLDAFPYFSRLEFRERRGARPYPTLRDPEQGIDR